MPIANGNYSEYVSIAAMFFWSYKGYRKMEAPYTAMLCLKVPPFINLVFPIYL